MAVVKRDCPTCVLVEPVLGQLAEGLGEGFTVYTQDDLSFPSTVPGVRDDTSLEVSWKLDLTTVPTLIRVEQGHPTERLEGWERHQWEAFTGLEKLGIGLPDYRPGCGSRTLDPGVADQLAVRFKGDMLQSRRVRLAVLEDEMEALFDRGWTDGLPVCPPPQAR